MSERAITVKFGISSTLSVMFNQHSETTKFFDREFLLRHELNKTSKKIRKGQIDDFSKNRDLKDLKRCFNRFIKLWRSNNELVKKQNTRANRKHRKKLAKLCLNTAKAMLK